MTKLPATVFAASVATALTLIGSVQTASAQDAAKEKCDALSGQAKDACQDKAKAEFAK